mmetsp:Transcript_46801/g.124273  ORF Transcript_46801/g.124273 Transcript_46801/m.124273 type:complete len:1414 (-) Transcript_46801:189-4430(-)
MVVWSTPITVKVFFESGREKEVRRAVLPRGAATQRSEFITLLQDRFNQLLLPRITYLDHDGDVLTITTDAELQEALSSKVTTFTVLPQPQSHERDGWEFVQESAPAHEGAADWSQSLRFWVNGEEINLENPSPSITLLDWLREAKGLTGTHYGCGEGGCGICTVALVTPSGDTVPINSCLRRLCAVDGCHVVTVQGLGNVQDGVHAIQKAIAEGNGSQCGFCTPGWVMNMYSLLENNADPTAEQIEQSFDGNLCRCTGYRPILSSFGDFAKGGTCCGTSQSIPMPPGMASYTAAPLHFVDNVTGDEYFRPLSFEDLLAAQEVIIGVQKRVHFMCANTSVGVTKYLREKPDGEKNDDINSVFIDTTSLPSFSTCTPNSSGIIFGSAVSIAEVINQLELAASPAFQEYVTHLKRVASVQIRSVGSWAGNLMLCRDSNVREDWEYFPSDVVLVLATAGMTVDIIQNRGKQTTVDVLTLMDMPGDVLVLSGTIPFPPKDHSLVKTFKMMRRHVFSHAIVNFGANLTFASDWTVQTARIIIGGATSTIKRVGQTEAALVGKSLTQSTLDAAMAALEHDIDDAPATGGLVDRAYNKEVAAGFLYKTFLASVAKLPDNYASALVRFTPAASRPVSTGTVDYGVYEDEAPVSTWAIKQEAHIQSTGEATYVSDQHIGAWFAQLVTSTSCNAKLVGMDALDAMNMPGVKEFVTASAIPQGGVNCWMGDYTATPGSDFIKEKIFFEVGDVIPYVGAQLGIIVAETWTQAHEAAKAVRQTYSAGAPPVMTLEDAKRHNMSVPRAKLNQVLADENVSRILRRTPTVPKKRRLRTDPIPGSFSAKSTMKTGAQVHFQLETRSTCAVPQDGDSLQMFVSGQSHALEQSAVSAALNMPRNKIRIMGHRVGGGFGGKIFWQLPSCCAVAVAANKLRRPIRLQNERREEVQINGTRPAINYTYETTFDSQGNLDTLDVTATSDAGHIPGIAVTLADMGTSQADLVFNWTGGITPRNDLFLTHKAAITAMRAPGSMQAALFTGACLEHIAKICRKEVEDVMEMNFYKAGDKSCINDSIVFGENGFDFTIPALWSQIKESSDFVDRKAAVEAYNAANRWTKKGIAMAPSKLDINVNSYWMSAHVTAYADGTVHVSTGGVELGQGLNTKVALVVARTLGIPVEHVRATGGDTQVAGNNALTGGSGTSESCCNAAIQAATALKSRIQDKLDAGTEWASALQAAKAEGVNLTTEGWFNGKNFETAVAPYSVYGSAVTEVLIDVMTGETLIERMDLIMDLGTQLDAAVDIGQIQGGVVISLGYLFTEETKWSAEGVQLYCGTWEYKLPTAYDIPLVFNVSLLKNSPNPHAVCLGSKAVAEPAMSLILSPFLAVKKAIYAARRELQVGDDWFQLDAPLSPQAIRNAIGLSGASMRMP